MRPPHSPAHVPTHANAINCASTGAQLYSREVPRSEHTWDQLVRHLPAILVPYGSVFFLAAHVVPPEAVQHVRIEPHRVKDGHPRNYRATRTYQAPTQAHDHPC